MLNLPEPGDRVRVWPCPGRRVQLDARPVAHDRGGRYLSDEGQEVVWSMFHLEQLRAGDIYLHAVLSSLAAEGPTPAGGGEVSAPPLDEPRRGRRGKE